MGGGGTQYVETWQTRLPTQKFVSGRSRPMMFGRALASDMAGIYREDRRTSGMAALSKKLDLAPLTLDPLLGTLLECLGDLELDTQVRP